MALSKTVRWLLLVLLLAALLLPCGLAPLVETTEARYSEIAREMLVSGNYLEPVFNGVKHFHKPPLAYWGVAAGMKIFGPNDFGARFIGIFFALLAVVYVYRLGALILQDKGKGIATAVIFATTLLFLGVARIASTEIYLTCFTVQAQFYLFRQLYGEKSRRNAILYALFLALGFLTKGPIIFLFTLLPYFCAKLFDSEHRKVFPTRDVLLGTLVFFALALPWYLLVIWKNPGLLYYFLKVQTVDRVVTNRFHRYQPPWYFLAVFTVTFLPYLFFFSKALMQPRDLPRRLKILIIYLAVPLLVFSLAKGKHATYILPFYGVAALLTGDAYSRPTLPQLRDLTLLMAGLLVVSPAVLVFTIKGAPLYGQLAVLAATLPGFWLIRQAWRQRRAETFLLWIGAILLLVGTSGYAVFGFSAHQKRGLEMMVGQINRLDPQREIPVVVFKDFLPSVSFYRGKLAVMALAEARETQFETDDSYRESNLQSQRELKDYLAKRQDIFLITDRKHAPVFEADYNFSCQEIFAQRKLRAYQCTADVPAD